ncbi:MAG: ATP-binding protein [Robiginitomaculum sp.]|nr:ATP-binding protein [Robiginitomaculum sp.]
MSKAEPFKFEFSLEVLNHLGRGLYRSFATVIAEAVSNAWDAGAERVDITIERDRLVIDDDGKGMDEADFRGRFLKVGYSRRDDPDNTSKRSVIGRKGIGKLAMLSISQKVSIISKKKDVEAVGGVVNNTVLDREIKKDGKYSLEALPEREAQSINTRPKGTRIIFEGIKGRINSEDIIRKYLATQFNFMFSLEKGDKFQIFVNNKEVTIEDLKELNDNTQFIWYLNNQDENIKSRYPAIEREKTIKKTAFEFKEQKIEVRGFIASVKVASNLLLRGSGGDFRASINLFCNGRLRQENLFDEITTKALTEEYLYGEVHVDGFEDEEIDRFTSSREGVIKDDPLYQAFLEKLREIQKIVIQDWTPWRVEIREEGDINHDNRPGYVVRMEESKNRREKDFKDKIDEDIKDPQLKKSLKKKLKSLSHNNTIVYQDLFILENIFREYIKLKNISESDLEGGTEQEKDILHTIRSIKGLRHSDEERHALKGNIVANEHYLNYLDLFGLGEVIDCKIRTKNAGKSKKNQRGLDLDTKEIGPIRNAIMHTNEIHESVLNWGKIKNVIDYIDRLQEKI